MSGLKERKRVTLLAGNTMNLNLRGCDVDLAICVSELLYKIDKNDTIIIENFDDSEYEGLLEVERKYYSTYLIMKKTLLDWLINLICQYTCTMRT